MNWLAFFQADYGGPVGALIEGSDGNFYGTTSGGSGGPIGSVFRITSAEGLTILHALGGTDGGDLEAGLVEATDGNFYGAAVDSGSFSGGTLFQVTPAGGFSVLHNFGEPNGSFGIIDATPLATPVQNTNGLLFGDTASGGTGTGCNGEEGCGVFYSWTATCRHSSGLLNRWVQREVRSRFWGRALTLPPPLPSTGRPPK